MTLIRIVALLISLTLISISSSAEITITNSWIRAVPAMMTNTSGYLRINNDTKDELILTGVRVSFAEKAEIHNHTMSNGLMSMGPAKMPIRIKAGTSLEFKPKGLHIMIMGLKAALKSGIDYQIELIFEAHESIRFNANVAMDSKGH